MKDHRAPQLSAAELDAAIAAAERTIVEREQRMRQELRALSHEAGAQAKRAESVALLVLGLGAGIAAVMALRRLGGRRRHRPSHRHAHDPGHRAAAFPPSPAELAAAPPSKLDTIARWLPLLWPWVPAAWQARLPVPVVTMVSGWLPRARALLRRR